MTGEQLALFSDDHTPPRNHCGRTLPCAYCGTPVPPPHFPGSTVGAGIECLECNHRNVLAWLTHYAKYGRPGRGKYPGMLFPGQEQGDGEPTAEQRAAMLAQISELAAVKPRNDHRHGSTPP
jgi:hypothetical protein